MGDSYVGHPRGPRSSVCRARTAVVRSLVSSLRAVDRKKRNPPVVAPLPYAHRHSAAINQQPSDRRLLVSAVVRNNRGTPIVARLPSVHRPRTRNPRTAAAAGLPTTDARRVHCLGSHATPPVYFPEELWRRRHPRPGRTVPIVSLKLRSPLPPLPVFSYFSYKSVIHNLSYISSGDAPAKHSSTCRAPPCRSPSAWIGDKKIKTEPLDPNPTA